MVHPIYSSFTLPKTNIAPENGPSQKERFGFPITNFQGQTVRFGGVSAELRICLDLLTTQDSSGKWRFVETPDPKNVTILVVTLTVSFWECTFFLAPFIPSSSSLKSESDLIFDAAQFPKSHEITYQIDSRKRTSNIAIERMYFRFKTQAIPAPSMLVWKYHPNLLKCTTLVLGLAAWCACCWTWFCTWCLGVEIRHLQRFQASKPLAKLVKKMDSSKPKVILLWSSSFRIRGSVGYPDRKNGFGGHRALRPAILIHPFSLVD